MRSATRPAPTSARSRSRAKRCCGRCGRRRSAVELLRPSSPEEAAAALRDGRIALAGGTDLVPLLREGLVEADTLVHLSHVVPRGVKSWGQSPAGTVPSGSAGGSLRGGTPPAQLEADPPIPAGPRQASAAGA